MSTEITTPETTTVIRIEELGAPEVMKYVEEPTPKPETNEVLVEMQAIGVGFGEALYRMGFYIQETKVGGSLGNNAIGRVLATGEGVTNVRPGDRVSVLPTFQMNKYGTYGKHMIVPAESLGPYFDDLSLEENAALWMQVMTAYGMIVHKGVVQKGDFALVVPSSGGIGLASIQTLQKIGAVVIAVTRSLDKADALKKEHGVDHVIVTSEEDLNERVKDITGGKGVKLALNALTGPILEQLADAMAWCGTIVQFGGIGGAAMNYPFGPMIAKNVTVRGFSLYELTYEAEKNMPKLIEYVKEGVKEGHYKAVVGHVFKFDEMVSVHHFLETGSMQGSVVVLV